MRPVIALCLAILAVQFAWARPSAPVPVREASTQARQEAALQPPSSARVPPPIVASGLPVPRWVTIKAGRVNVRRGPSMEHDILWTYVKAGRPIEVIAEYDTWRRIRDSDGSVGWVKSAMLDGRRSVVIRGHVNAELLSEPKEGSRTIAYAEPGLVAELVSCAGTWCEISSRGYDGYVRRDRLWGVYPHETIR